MSSRLPEHGQQDFARSFCTSAIATYWTALCARRRANLPLRPFPLELVSPLNNSAEDRAAQIGAAAARLSDDSAAYELSSLYTSMLPSEVRARFGVFYTPPALVDRLLGLVTESGFDWNSGNILDPACGGGAFLAPIARRIANDRKKDSWKPSRIVQDIASRVHGIEIDPFAGWMSQVFLDAALLDLTKDGLRVPQVVSAADALTAKPGNVGGDYDLVIGNPPYGRITLADELRTKYAASLYGHANLYGLFTHLAVTLVRPGGLIAYVTPTSFLGGQYFKNLRGMLLREAPPVMIDFISDRSGVFEDVLQETMLTVYRQQDHVPDVAVHLIAPSEGGRSCEISSLGEFAHRGGLDGPWLFPRQPDQSDLLGRVAQLSSRLANYGYGVNTGPLVWNRHKDQLMSAAGADRYPLIWAESVRPDGTFSFASDRRNHQPFFRLRSSQEHLLTRDPCILVQRTTAKEQIRRLNAAVLPISFIEEHDGVVIENHLNIVRPLGVRPAVPLDVLAALLNSTVVDRIFRCINGSVAVSAYELESLPFPPVAQLKNLTKLVRRAAPRTALDACVAEAYGVQP